ncbi:MAG: ATP-grasp domain-containing protein [Firmicutes bacterium]|nr:ATP-grasp domain-containing protein [Bacillota bacterium]
MKKVMILGAGRGQVGLYNAAKRLGYETIAVSIDGDWPGFALADRIYYLNLYDTEGIAALAEEIGADGVVTACLEIGLPALGAACDRNHLPGISYETALISTDKLLMKEALMKGGVRTARFRRAAAEEDLEDIKKELDFPLITKAVDLSGTRGIHIAFEEKDLLPCFRKTMEATGKDYCVIEEYLEGYECSATSLIANGKVAFVLPTGDLRYGENDEVPIGHYLPYEDSEDILQQIEEEVTKAIYAIGLDNCAVNVDIMICRGKAYILELTGRIGANAMPELTSIYYGFDIHEMIVETAVGNFDMAENFAERKIPRTACIGEMILSEKEGTIRCLSIDEPDPEHVEQVWMFVSEGSEIRKFTNPKDCIGQIVVKGDDLEQCRRIADETVAGIHIELEQERE